MECKTRPQAATVAAAENIEKREESKQEDEENERYSEMEH